MKYYIILIRYIERIEQKVAIFWKRQNFAQAKAITDYRRLHGPLHSLNELRLSKDFPPEAIKRLLPYVAY